MYGSSLNSAGLRCWTPAQSKIHIGLLTPQSSLRICRGLIPEPQEVPESTDGQVPYIKRRRTLHIVGPPHSWTPIYRSKILFSNCSLLNPRMWKAWGYGGPNAYSLKNIHIHVEPCSPNPCCSRVQCTMGM